MEAIWVAAEMRAGGAYAHSAAPRRRWRVDDASCHLTRTRCGHTRVSPLPAPVDVGSLGHAPAARANCPAWRFMRPSGSCSPGAATRVRRRGGGLARASRGTCAAPHARRFRAGPHRAREAWRVKPRGRCARTSCAVRAVSACGGRGRTRRLARATPVVWRALGSRAVSSGRARRVHALSAWPCIRMRIGGRSAPPPSRNSHASAYARSISSCA